MSSSAFHLDQTQSDTLAVSGALTFDTAAQVLEQVTARLDKGATGVLDLAAVGKTDSAGLACVLALMAAARCRGGRLEVRNLPQSLRLLAAVSDAEPLLGLS